MSNLLTSKPDDLTPQGSNPTTIIQKVIEICKAGNTANRTGRELASIKEHQNSVFTYKGQPATYVSDSDGVFNFGVLDITNGSPVLHYYSVDGQKNITQGDDISFGGGSDLPDVSASDNGDVLAVVEGEWAKAELSLPIAVIEFAMGESGSTSVKTASEIFALANAGKYLVGRVLVSEDMVMQVQIGMLDAGENYTMVVSVVTSEAETPICITATANTGTDHFTISLG